MTYERKTDGLIVLMLNADGREFFRYHVDSVESARSYLRDNGYKIDALPIGERIHHPDGESAIVFAKAEFNKIDKFPNNKF
jgi:hypothetical protein